ncbi:MAG: cobalamin B12-binding domain-containing protein [Pseudomonadota bacterium]
MLENADFSASPSWDANERLARKALALLGAHSRARGEVHQEAFEPAPVFMNLLQKAALSTDCRQAAQALGLMGRVGISDAELVDHYIPSVARAMGELWVADRLDFAAVSIGSSRLQNMMRTLDVRRQAPTDQTYRSALVIVPEGVQHTLGATVISHQLRRAGVEVTLELEANASKVERLIDDMRPGALMISASCQENLESLARLVDMGRSGWGLPVLIGGSITLGPANVREQTGADHVGNRWQSVLPFLAKEDRP